MLLLHNQISCFIWLAGYMGRGNEFLVHILTGGFGAPPPLEPFQGVWSGSWIVVSKSNSFKRDIITDVWGLAPGAGQAGSEAWPREEALGKLTLTLNHICNIW